MPLCNLVEGAEVVQLELPCVPAAGERIDYAADAAGQRRVFVVALVTHVVGGVGDATLIGHHITRDVLRVESVPQAG